MARLTSSLCAVALASAVVGCRSEVKPPIGQDRPGPPQRGGILRTAFYTDVRGLDPAIAYSTTAAALQGLVFDRLVKYDRNSKIVGELAKTIDTSPDGKKLVFTLRRGVRFHDGGLLTASDVKRSIERALHTKTPCLARRTTIESSASRRFIPEKLRRSKASPWTGRIRCQSP